MQRITRHLNVCEPDRDAGTGSCALRRSDSGDRRVHEQRQAPGLRKRRRQPQAREGRQGLQEDPEVVAWNQTGPQGAAGAQGPAGAAGAAGAPGAPAVTLWAEVNASGELVASNGVTNVTGNASGRLFTFNRDISKCGISATLNEGPATIVYAARNAFPNQVVTKTSFGKEEEPAAGGVDLVISC